MQENNSNCNSSNILEEDLDDNCNDISSLSQESQSLPSPCSSTCNSDNDEHNSHVVTKNFNSIMASRTIIPISTSELIAHDTTNTASALNSKKKVLTGVIVNGFHPQLHTWQENSCRCTDGDASNNKNVVHNRNNRHKRSRETSSLLDEKIQEKVSRARNDTVKNLHIIQNARQEGVATVMLREQKPSILKMYTDMFENSSVPQLITAPGGRIAAWNQEFLKIIDVIRQNNTGSLDTLTAFDIVSPTMIPKLYEIFLMALTLDNDNYYYPFQGGLREEEDSEVKYPSLTVPCVNFGTQGEAYYITFSLMHDKNPDKRCFHCIIQKEPKVSIGEIYSVSQKFLMEML